jgi:hypothetical protein
VDVSITIRLVVVVIDSSIFYFKLRVLSWLVKGDCYLLVLSSSYDSRCNLYLKSYQWINKACKF